MHRCPFVSCTHGNRDLFFRDIEMALATRGDREARFTEPGRTGELVVASHADVASGFSVTDFGGQRTDGISPGELSAFVSRIVDGVPTRPASAKLAAGVERTNSGQQLGLF